MRTNPLGMSTLSLFDQGPFPPCPAPFNLAGYVLVAGEKTPEKTALEILSPGISEKMSYGALRRAVLGVGGSLLALGLKPGDRVLLRIGHDPLFPLVFLGAIAVGLVPVPTSADLSAREFLSITDEIAPKLTIFGPGVSIIEHFAHPHLTEDQARHLPEGEIAAIHLTDPETLAYIIYTSGTSGRPLAVMHAHRAIWARRMMWRDWYDLTPSDRMFHAGAFNWTFTLGTGLLDPWSIGATALITRSGVEISDLAQLISEHKASIFAAAPGVYRRMLKSDLMPGMPSLRHGLSAGEKLPPAVRADWTTRTGRPIFEALGMSEISTFVSQFPGKSPSPEVSGHPQRGRRAAVLDPETHRPVKIGAQGILAIDRKDPGLMLGYRNAEDLTRARFSGDWFLTGDMVRMATDHAITYLGRNDDMLNAGGFRVSPLEIEAVFLKFPGLNEAAAVEVKTRSGAGLIALGYVSDEPLDPDALAAFGASILARYKCPRIFHRLDTLPKGANNKIKRGEIRRMLKAIP